jgi:anti-sigma regulatory factor (Ser/Thr protein kinase)
VPAPTTQAAAETDERALAPVAPTGQRHSLAALSVSAGSVLAGAIAPMTSVLLSETERRFKLRGLSQAVGAARRALRDWEGHFEPDLFYDLSLCVSELVSNTVRQGQPAGGDELELGVWRSDMLVRAEIREPRADLVVSKPAAMVARDWGMFIVDRVADRWGVDRSEGTLVWCEIDLAADGRARRAAI